MDNKDDVRDFLATRRTKITPQDALNLLASWAATLRQSEAADAAAERP